MLANEVLLEIPDQEGQLEITGHGVQPGIPDHVDTLVNAVRLVLLAQLVEMVVMGSLEETGEMAETAVSVQMGQGVPPARKARREIRDQPGTRE